MPANVLLQLSRKVHLYLGLFIAPMLLFFAFTGAVQTLSLHEAAAYYKPPALLASLGQIHKKQTYSLPVRRAPGPGEPNRPGNNHADAPKPAAQQPLTLQAKQHQHLALKIFFLLVSLGLFTSTLTGIYMAYRYDRNAWLVTGLLVAGVLTPILLVRP